MSGYNRSPDTARSILDLARRVQTLESTPAYTAAIVTGAPSGPAPEGQVVGDKSSSRLYVREGGAWRFVSVT